MKYAYSCDRPPLSGLANEDGILPGELVYADSNGVVKATPSAGLTMGVVEDFADEHIATHSEDYRSSIKDFTYDIGMRVQFSGDEHGAKLRVLTPVDNGTDPAPNIGDYDIVGVPARAGMEGRIVEEGYTDGQGTPVTYNRSNGNFLPVGVARATSQSVPQTGFDSLTHIVRRTDL